MPIQYVVKQGDCLSSIAIQYGLHPDTIWKDPANSAIQQERPDPNVLSPGDHIYIPNKRLKEVSCATGTRHRFRRLGIPTMLHIRFLDMEDKPRGNLPYRLDIDGQLVSGSTTFDGFISIPIPSNAKTGHLFLSGDSDTEEEHIFHFGHLDPIECPQGIQARLHNAGFYDGPITNTFGETTRAALQKFQEHLRIPVSGELDPDTKYALQGYHGS